MCSYKKKHNLDVNVTQKNQKNRKLADKLDAFAETRLKKIIL